MSIPRLRDWWLLLLLVTPLAALSAVASEAAERERIARERAAVERESRAAQAACANQFAVTACIDQAKAARRQRLQALDRQRALLDDDLRKRRAAARIEQIRQRQATVAEERPEVTVRARSAPASAATMSDVAPTRSRSVEATLAARQAAASQADTEAALRVRAAQRRASEAEAHRRAVEKRNQGRATSHPPGKPLPVLPAASQAQ